MLKSMCLLALLAGVVSCAGHAFHCRTPQRPINVAPTPEAR